MFAFLTIVIAILLLWALIYVRLLIHELGHVLAALLVGWKPYFLLVGVGSQRRLGRIGSVRIRVASKPTGGLTRAVAFEPKSLRWKSFIYIAGGPIATTVSILCLVAAYRFFEESQWADWNSVIIGFSLCHEVVFLIANLFPHDIRRSGLKLYSDGKALWKTLRLPHRELLVAFDRRRIAYAALLLEEGRSEAAIHVLSGVVDGGKNARAAAVVLPFLSTLLSAGQIKDACEEAETILNNSHGFGEGRARVMDGIASIPVFSEHPEFVPIAMRCVDEAIRLEPQTITLKGTKASLLVEQGSIDAAIAMLEEVKAQSQAETDQAICSYYLAYAALKKGNAVEATALFEQSRKNYPNCSVAAKIGKKIADSASIAAG